MKKRENILLIVRKEPGKDATVDYIENRLEVFQAAVGGYIETVRFAQDGVLIVNEEGRLLGLPDNTVMGMHLVGTVVCVGVKGEEFAGLKAANVPILLRGMRNRDAGTA